MAIGRDMPLVIHSRALDSAIFFFGGVYPPCLFSRCEPLVLGSVNFSGRFCLASGVFFDVFCLGGLGCGDGTE